MVKKSLLGRIFGKKGSRVEDSKKKAGSAKGSATGTATMTKDTKGSATDPAKKAVLEGRFAKEGAPGAAVEPGDGKPGKEHVHEPEILSREEKEASESREKIDVIAKKMSSQEEASIKISDGIKGLSGVLSNIDQRLQEQTQQSFEIARTVKTIPEMMKDMPESQRAGIELLHSITQILENQSSATFELGNKISDLPKVLNNLTEQINKDTETRTEERADFKESVDTMKQSIGKLEERNRELNKSQVESTKKIVDSFKNVQDDQQRQIGTLVEKNRVTNLLMIFLIFVILGGMIAIVALLAQ
jgi:small-conductance mechanosensitive channel